MWMNVGSHCTEMTTKLVQVYIHVAAYLYEAWCGGFSFILEVVDICCASWLLRPHIFFVVVLSYIVAFLVNLSLMVGSTLRYMLLRSHTSDHFIIHFHTRTRYLPSFTFYLALESSYLFNRYLPPEKEEKEKLLWGILEWSWSSPAVSQRILIGFSRNENWVRGKVKRLRLTTASMKVFLQVHIPSRINPAHMVEQYY